jgi:hypothetical protein
MYQEKACIASLSFNDRLRQRRKDDSMSSPEGSTKIYIDRVLKAVAFA